MSVLAHKNPSGSPRPNEIGLFDLKVNDPKVINKHITVTHVMPSSVGGFDFCFQV